jgi:hypothetical protein
MLQLRSRTVMTTPASEKDKVVGQMEKKESSMKLK